MKSKKIALIVILLSIMSVSCAISAFVVYAINKANKTIELTALHNGETVDIVGDAVEEYLSAEGDEAQIDALLKNQCSDDWVKEVTLSWKQNGSAFYTVYLSENQAFEDATVEKVFGYTPTLDLYNLIPGTTYYWKVKGTYSGDESAVGTFTTEESKVRTIYVDGVSNVRDLGGYETTTGEVKYGLLYRGGKLNGTTSGEAITEEGKSEMLDSLKIKTEIDLRSVSDDGGQTENAIGEGVNYIKIPLGQYANILDYETWSILDESEKSGNFDANNKNAVKQIFELLADENNYPIYFHCNAGADRTGTLALLINGLLGVDEQMLIKDYELTTISRYGKRLRSSLTADNKTFTETGVMQNDGGNYVAMGLFIDSLKSAYTDNGDINEAVYNYLIEYIGLSNDTLDKIKSIMLSQSESDEIDKKVASVQEILLTDSVKAINIAESGVSLANIESVKIGSMDLGNNLADLNFGSVSEKLFGEREIIVKGKGADGKNYRIEVPVLIITKNIDSAEALREVVEYSESNLGKYGYYRLTQDITYAYSASYGANITQDLGVYGFKGVIDGKDSSGNVHTIKYDSVSWSNGIFGMVGVGGTIKNVKFSGKYSGNQAPFIAATIVGATFENVQFDISGGREQIAGMNGLITKCMACGSTFKNVTINAEGVIIDSLFGCSQYAGYKTEKPCYFDNFVVNADEILELAHEKSTDDDLKSISIYSVGGIKGNLSKTSEETSVVHLSNKYGYLTIDDEFADAEIVSVTFDGKVITDFVRVNGMIKFALSDLFTEGNFGIKEVEVNLITERGINVRLKHNVDVRSDLVVVDFSTVQNIVLSNEKIALSLNDTEGDYSAYTNVNSIMYGSYNFGTDLSALDVSAIAEIYELHGENKTLEVFASNGAKNVLIRIPVTIITKEIKTFDELMQSVTARNNAVEKNGAYYTLGNDIDAEGKTIYTFLGENGSTITPEYCEYGKGFAGTLNGKGYKVYNLNLDSSGIFRGMKDATVKNISFEIANYSEETQGAALFASNVQDCLFEKVTVTVTKAINMETNNNIGLLVAQQTGGTTFETVNVIAEKSILTTLVGNGYWSGNNGKNKYENCTVSCSKLKYIGGNESSNPSVVGSTDGITAELENTVDFVATQQLILGLDEKSLSLVDGENDYSSMTVTAITCLSYDLGSDINNLDLDGIKADMSAHGENVITVVGIHDGAATTLTIPVLFVTDVLTKENIKANIQSQGTALGEGAYYILQSDIDASGIDWKASMLWDQSQGFKGTIDGRGYTVKNLNIGEGVPGIFNCTQDAVVKNIGFTIANFVPQANQSVFGVITDHTLFENVNITFNCTFTATTGGILSGNNAVGNTYKDVKIVAGGSEIYYLVSHASNGGSHFENVTAEATKINYIYGTISSVNGITTGETKEITLTNNQDILLTSETYAISLGSEGTGLTVNSITCNGVDLGTNLSNLDMSAIKSDMTKHGITNVIVKGEKDGNKVTVIAPVTIITKQLESGADFKEATYCANSSEGEKNKGAYYVIPWNLNVVGTGFTGGEWINVGDAGFAGTIDGRGHKIVNVSLTDSSGIFNALKGATIKNLEIEVKNLNAQNGNASVFGFCADNTIFEDVTITFKDTFTNATCGLIGGGNQSRNCTFKNITVNAQGSDIYRLFSGGDIVKDSKNNISGVTVNAKSVQYMYATTDLAASGFDVTVNLDENQ